MTAKLWWWGGEGGRWWWLLMMLINDDDDADDRQWQATRSAGFAQTGDLLLRCSHHLPDRFQPVFCAATDQVCTTLSKNINEHITWLFNYFHYNSLTCLAILLLLSGVRDMKCDPHESWYKDIYLPVRLKMCTGICSGDLPFMQPTPIQLAMYKATNMIYI